MASRLKKAVATGVLQAGKLYLKSAVIVAGGVAGTAALRDSTDGSGPIVLTLKALANDRAVWRTKDRRGPYFVAGLHVTLTGAGAELSAEYEA